MTIVMKTNREKHGKPDKQNKLTVQIKLDTQQRRYRYLQLIYRQLPVTPMRSADAIAHSCDDLIPPELGRRVSSHFSRSSVLGFKQADLIFPNKCGAADPWFVKNSMSIIGFLPSVVELKFLTRLSYAFGKPNSV